MVLIFLVMPRGVISRFHQQRLLKKAKNPCYQTILDSQTRIGNFDLFIMKASMNCLNQNKFATDISIGKSAGSNQRWLFVGISHLTKKIPDPERKKSRKIPNPGIIYKNPETEKNT